MTGTIVAILDAATTGLPIATRNGLVEVADFDGKKLPSKREGKKFVPVVGDKYGSLSYWRQTEKMRSRIVQGVTGAQEEATITLRWVAVLSRDGEGPCEDIGNALNAVRNSIYLGKGAVKSTLSASIVTVEVTSMDTDSERVYREELGEGVLPMQWRMVSMEVRVVVNSKPGCLPSCLDTVVPTVGAVPVGCVDVDRLCGGDPEDGQVLTWDAGLQKYKPETTGTGPSGSGDVVGPASATANNFVAFNGTTGKLIKDSGVNATSFDAAGSASAAQAEAISAAATDATTKANAAYAAATAASDPSGSAAAAQAAAISAAASDATTKANAAQAAAIATSAERPIMVGIASFTWTNMPAAVTFQSGSSAFQVGRPYDLSRFTQVRYTITMGSVAGAAGSKIYLRYVTSYNATAANYLQLGATEVECAVSGTNTIVDSGWINLAAGAITTSTFIAVLGSGGNGAADPTIGGGTILFR